MKATITSAKRIQGLRNMHMNLAADAFQAEVDRADQLSKERDRLESQLAECRYMLNRTNQELAQLGQELHDARALIAQLSGEVSKRATVTVEKMGLDDLCSRCGGGAVDPVPVPECCGLGSAMGCCGNMVPMPQTCTKCKGTGRPPAIEHSPADTEEGVS